MKIKNTLVILLMMILSAVSFAQDKQDWKFMHPNPQSNLLRKIKMIDETNWVAAGGNGTFMHTTNSGVNWYFHHFAGRISAALATTQCYDLWFFDANTGVVVGDQGYVGRTTDGGVNFDSVAVGLIPANSRCWSVWFADANTGYIGAGSQSSLTTQILKTTNGGANWSVVYTNNTGYVTTIGGIDANTIFATQYNDGTVLKSTNGGTNWTSAVSAIAPNMNNLKFLNATYGFAAGSEGKFSRTTNGGANWESKNVPSSDWAMFQVKAVSATEIYAVGNPGILYKTTDMGDTWQSLPISVSGPSVTFVWYSLDNYGSTFVLSGDYGVVAKSTDGCATWSSNSYNISTALMFDMASIPGTGKYWTVGRGLTSGQRNVLYSSNGGSNWVYYNTGVGVDFFSISMVNETTGYISGQNSTVMKTTDGGVTWIATTKPHLTNYSLQTIKFINPDTGWCFVNFATVPGGNVFKTTNGGDNWTQYTTGAPSENIINAEMVDANTGFVCMNPSNRPIYKTTNGGVNWTPYTTGLTGNIRGISSPDGGNTVYACQTSGTSRVAKSTNGGVNWSLITLPVVADFTSIDFVDVNTGFVSGNSTAVVAKTTNGGANWTFQNTHNITLVDVYATSGDTAFVLGGNTSIIRYAMDFGSVELNLTAAIQGLYNPGTGTMSRNDSIKVYLRSNVVPYNRIDSAAGTLDATTLTGHFTFNDAPAGSYYVEVNNFNNIETWSKTPLALGYGMNSYDFTTAATTAFGNNLVLQGSDYCMYIGDLNNDGVVNIADIVKVSNDATSFTTGYVNSDVNGDNTVNLADITIIFNNSTSFIHRIIP